MLTSTIGIQGIRYDAQSSFLRGAADAPPLIREAFLSLSANRWSESGIDLGGVVADHGDIARAVAARHGPLDILHFDAHPDLYDEFEGNRVSHACPFARILEAGLARRLVQVGIRTAHGHQREQARRFRVETIEMRDFRDDWVPRFDGPLYISFDIDALDPACAPGVSHPEPGGFTTRQALRVIQSLAGTRIVAADIVEFNPQAEARLTAVVAAKLLKEIASTMLAFPGCLTMC